MNRLIRTAPLLTALILLLCGATPAQANTSRETAWTNTEGVTIWARLVGWNDGKLLLQRRGRIYQVAPGTLSAESCRKAWLSLDLDVARLPAHARVSDSPALPSRSGTPHKAVPLPKAVPAPAQPAELVTLDDLVPVSNNTSASLPRPKREWVDQSREDLRPNRVHMPLPVKGAAGPLPMGSLLPPRKNAPQPSPPHANASSDIRLDGKRAIAPSGIPSVVSTVIAAANRLRNKPYVWGGGHARVEDRGYDCSGSVSYALIKAGLLRSPLTSRGFLRYGKPGKGRWVTIYAKNGHVFMTVCGLRFDTGGHNGRGESGPRWRPGPRSTRGFVTRHPAGF